MALLERYKNDIIRLCENYRVRKLYAFGSVLSSRFSQESDVDLIVEFKTRDLEGYADNYFDFKSSLEAVFQRSVDLLEEKAIKNPFFKEAVFEQRQLIYGN